MDKHIAEKTVEMLAIATKAIDVFHVEDALAAASADLNDGYWQWKHDNSIEYVTRDTPEWEAMMEGTAAQHRAVEAEKRKLRNAKKRLRNAIVKFNGWEQVA